MLAQLPNLTNKPIQHPDCCASLSPKLLDNIVAVLPRDDASIVSIGCGSGLLEALLLQKQPKLRMLGIEVASCTIQYLSLEHVRKVSGTWEICADAFKAEVWLFVYPRTIKLVTAYLNSSAASRVRTIIWIGPTRDWADFWPGFQECDFVDISEVEDAGLANYESMIVIRKMSAISGDGDAGRSRDSHADEIDDI